MARGTWALIVLFLLASVAGGFLWQRSLKADDIQITWEIAPSPPLVMGVIPYLPEQLLKREFRALTGFLATNLQREVHLNFAVDYESLGRLLELEKVQLAWFSANSFDALNRGRWEVICRPLREGADRHRGAIVVREDSGIKSLADLKGKRFAYVDPHSGTGFVMANRLFGSQGIDPLRFFSDVVFTGNHSISIAGVLAGEYDAAAVYDVFTSQASGAHGVDLQVGAIAPASAFDALAPGSFTPFLIPSQVAYGVTVKPATTSAPVSSASLALASESSVIQGSGYSPPGLLCIAVTDWLLNDPVVVRKDMDPALKEELRNQLVHMDQYPDGKEVLVELAQLRKWNGFVDERTLTGSLSANLPASLTAFPASGPQKP